MPRWLWERIERKGATMNDAERRQLERDATEHVAEGNIHYGTAE